MTGHVARPDDAGALAARVAGLLPGAYRTLMGLSLHGGRARASSLAGFAYPPRHEEFEETLAELARLGLVTIERPFSSVVLRAPGRREVVLARAGEDVAGRLWERVGREEMERKVRFVCEDPRRVRVLGVLRFGRMEAAELRLHVELFARWEAEAVASDLAREGLVFTVGEFYDGDFVLMSDVGLTGDGFVIGREAARRYPPQATSARDRGFA